MRRSTHLVPLAACVALAACDVADHTTAPRAPNGPASLDLVGPPPPPVYIGYSLTDISAGLTSRATDINNQGWVVGTHTIAGSPHGFVRHPDGSIEDIPP